MIYSRSQKWHCKPKLLFSGTNLLFPLFFFPGNSGEITSAPKGLRNFFGWCFQPKYYRLCQFLIWHLAELMVCVNQFLSPCSSAVLNANGANRPHLPQQETVINGMSNKTVTIGNCTFPFRTSSVGKCMKLFTLCKRCWEQDLVSVRCDFCCSNCKQKVKCLTWSEAPVKQPVWQKQTYQLPAKWRLHRGCSVWNAAINRCGNSGNPLQ